MQNLGLCIAYRTSRLVIAVRKLYRSIEVTLLNTPTYFEVGLEVTSDVLCLHGYASAVLQHPVIGMFAVQHTCPTMVAYRTDSHITLQTASPGRTLSWPMLPSCSLGNRPWSPRSSKILPTPHLTTSESSLSVRAIIPSPAREALVLCLR
jgi:hypothetical protein